MFWKYILINASPKEIACTSGWSYFGQVTKKSFMNVKENFTSILVMHMGKNMKIGVCTINYLMSFICSGMDIFKIC